MDENGGDQPERGRSKRTIGAKKASRLQGLDELKAKRQGAKKWQDDEEIQNVYDIVDEKDYCDLVAGRQNEDWIVDDDGEYVEDGREIFDEEMGDEKPGQRSTKGLDKSKKSGHNKKKDTNNTTSEESSSSQRNIKNMFLGGATKRKIKTDADLQNDEVLGELLGQIGSSGTKKSETNLHKKARGAEVGGGGLQAKNNSPHNNPFAVRPSSTGLKKIVKKPVTTEAPISHQAPKTQNVEKEVPLSQAIEDDDFTEDMFNEPMEVDSGPSQIIDDDDDEEEKEEETKETTTKTSEEKENLAENTNRGFKTTKLEGTSKPDIPMMMIKSTIENPSTFIPDVKIDPGKLPLITNSSGDKVLRMYWLDAFEDYFKHPGTVWLFGKVYVESAKSYVSCCVTVKNIERQVFFCPKEGFTVADIYNEFAEKISNQLKIMDFKAAQPEMKYAFEHSDIPDVATYLQVLYPSKYPAIPSALTGKTFSRIFGANQSSLERFLLTRKIKGPCWLDIKMVSASDPPSSWCKFEAICDNPNNVSVLMQNAPPAPPVTILALNMKTTINPKTHQNEITLVSGLMHNKFYLDKPAPKTPYVDHFCALTRPSDEIWPFDFQKILDQNKSSISIKKMDSERALLNFLIAKIGMIDPDVIIGHDVVGFDLEVLLHRAIINKVQNWSKLGRLKRSQPNTGSKGRIVDRFITTGRLVCDLKISAKELIRCKSYDLGALIEKLLFKPQENRFEVDVDAMKKAYGSSKSLMQVTSACLQDAEDTLRCICDLNALPLALQITQVAGNVMSRTLLGGRAERNEFLLLHAFNEKNYIVPDKQYGGKKVKPQDDGMDDMEADTTTTKAKGRRKPAYAGGLVLEPKKGFYDNFILLMDFNSLYPSIIQEYNICFTTVDRKKPTNITEEEYIPELPEDGTDSGVLPTEIRKLVESRKAVKRLLKEPNLSEDLKLQYDIRQKALKLTANSMYGCLGFTFSRFYAKPIAALVTSRGREILLQTKKLVEQMNLEVIYGDTDSIMINSNSVNYDEVFKLGAQIKTAVNKTYKLLELDIDGVYRYMLLLKKKKYAAVTMERKPDGQLVSSTELKGLDIVRRDWSQLAATTGKEILSKILSDCNSDERVAFIHETLSNIAKDLKNGKVGLADLAITKSLTKDPNDYPDKKSLPHVQVALRVNSNAGKKLRAGDTVQYVICDDGSNLAATQRAYHVDEVKENQSLKVDFDYYLAQQLHPVVSRLCDPLDGTDSSRIAQCLGLDPEQYRKTIRTDNHHDDEQGIKDEDRFRQCERFKITCNCGENIVLDSISRGLGKDMRLALYDCPNVQCQKHHPLIEKIGLIKNLLTKAMRLHIQKYYSGWIVCEDPGCSGRTRRCPLSFQRAFPICNTCFKATMYREYTEKQLYTQLMFYQSLFDLNKFTDTYPDFKFKYANDWNIMQQKYQELYNLVKSQLMSNKYCMVDLNKVFEGYFPVTTQDRKKS